MLSANKMSTQDEQIADSCMRVQKPLSLPNRLEISHPAFSNPGRLMRLIGTIILILLSTVDRVRH